MKRSRSKQLNLPSNPSSIKSSIKSSVHQIFHQIPHPIVDQILHRIFHPMLHQHLYQFSVKSSIKILYQILDEILDNSSVKSGIKSSINLSSICMWNSRRDALPGKRLCDVHLSFCFCEYIVSLTHSHVVTDSIWVLVIHILMQARTRNTDIITCTTSPCAISAWVRLRRCQSWHCPSVASLLTRHVMEHAWQFPQWWNSPWSDFPTYQSPHYH